MGATLSRARGRLAREAFRLGAGNLPPLVLMTDDERLPDPCAAAGRLPRGSLIVLRAQEKRRRGEMAGALARIARARGLYLLIAEDPALARFADGVHFPEAHMGAVAYWRARRPGWFLTTSAHSLEAVQRAASFGADAVFLSPVFPTASHIRRAALTPIRFRLMAREARVPVYALGGIDADNVRRLAGANLAGVAAIGALSSNK
jgi:thiamine-phosphate pyrophosphorylase